MYTRCDEYVALATWSCVRMRVRYEFMRETSAALYNLQGFHHYGDPRYTPYRRFAHDNATVLAVIGRDKA